MKFKVNVRDIPNDSKLKKEDGWNRMQIQWLCTTANLGSQHAVLGRTVFPPNGASHELHVHENAEEILYVASGSGQARVADEKFEIEKGDVIFVPVGAQHFFINTSTTEDMETIWLYGGVGSLEASGYRPIKE